MLENNQKIKNIAVSSYFLILVSGLLFLNKDNPKLQNSFIKSHTKTAFLIHALMLFIYIIFIIKGYFNFYQFFTFGSNQIIATILFILLFIALLFGMYKAYKGEEIAIKDFSKKRKNKIVNLQEDVKITEKGIFSIIMTYIPFVGFLNAGKIKQGSFLNILKLNTYLTLFLIILYIIGVKNTINFIILFYIIFIVLVSIMLIINKTFIKIDLHFLPTFRELCDYIKITFIYIKNYFGNNFKNFEKVKKEFFEKKLILEKKELELLNSEEKLNFSKKQENNKEGTLKQDFKINKKLIYFPIFNLIFLFFKNRKYKTHIINGLILTFFTIIFISLDLYKNFYLSPYYYFFIIFGIFYGIGNLNIINYKFPFFYDIYEGIIFLINKIKIFFGIINEKHNEKKEINLKVGEKNNLKKD